jgi:hypothetical protein
LTPLSIVALSITRKYDTIKTEEKERNHYRKKTAEKVASRRKGGCNDGFHT